MGERKAEAEKSAAERSNKNCQPANSPTKERKPPNKTRPSNTVNTDKRARNNYRHPDHSPQQPDFRS